MQFPFSGVFFQLLILSNWGLSAGTGKLCIFGRLGLVFIWSCFVSCLLLLLYYVICAPVLTEGTLILWGGGRRRENQENKLKLIECLSVINVLT